MSPKPTTTLDPVVDPALDVEALYRAWHGADTGAHAVAAGVRDAILTIARDAANDFRDRQVYLYLDGEPLGKLKYGVPITLRVPPGRHTVRAFNTLLSHTIELDVAPGEQVRLRCTNGMPAGGWLMLLFLHATYLSVRLERVDPAAAG
ncbi:MAG: hypothetical protein AB7O67_09730 [Vicinamibacterales bacterium]